MLWVMRVVAIWILIIFNTCIGLLSQDSGQVFRFDPKNSLSFRSDGNVNKMPSEVSPGKLRAVVDFKKIRVLSDGDDNPLHEIATPHRAMAPTFSPDQKFLAFADCTSNLACESFLYVYDFESGEMVELGSCFGVTIQITFSANGKRFAAVSIYDPVMVLQAQQQLKKSLGGEIVVFDVDKKAELLKLAYDKPSSQLAAHESVSQVVDAIALDEDGTTLLVTALSGVVKVIDVNTGAEKISIRTRVAGQSYAD